MTDNNKSATMRHLGRELASDIQTMDANSMDPSMASPVLERIIRLLASEDQEAREAALIAARIYDAMGIVVANGSSDMSRPALEVALESTGHLDVWQKRGWLK